MIEFFRSLQGIVLIGAAALIGVWGWVASIKSKAVMQERASVQLKATQNAAKADAARRSVERIPAERLRDRYCRDC